MKNLTRTTLFIRHHNSNFDNLDLKFITIYLTTFLKMFHQHVFSSNLKVARLRSPENLH